MKSKITLQLLFRKFTAILLSSAILCSSHIQSVACGAYEESYDYYHLIEDRSLSSDPFGPYYVNGHTLFSRSDSPDNTFLGNIEAWQAYFDVKEPEAIRTLIFDSKPEEFDQFIAAIKSKGTLPPQWQNNPLAKKLAGKPNAPVVDYLQFSKRCEPHFTTYSSWWEDAPTRDEDGMKKLLEEGQTLMKKTKDKELKMRYQYQLLRLNFYLENYAEVNKIYSEQIEKSKWNNKLRFQAMNYDFGAQWNSIESKDSMPPAQKAGLILKLYKVFQSCEDCAVMYYRDLSYFNAEDYLQAVTVMEDPQDKVDLWMLASFESVPMHVAMDKILMVNPNAPELELLLYQMLQTAQFERLQKTESTLTDYFAVEEWNQIQMVLKKASINNKVTNRASYAFLLAYLDYMNGKYRKARTEVQNAELLNGDQDPRVTQNIRVLRSLLDLETWNSTNLEKSHQLPAQLNEVLAIGNAELTEYTFRRLADLAGLNPNLEKEALLFASMHRSIQDDLDLRRITMLETSRDNLHQTGLERWLWQHNDLPPSTLHRWKGDAYLTTLDFAMAAQEYRKAGISDNLMTNPFVMRLVDCHDCDHNEYPGSYTRLAFCEKMLDLKKAADKGNAGAAMEYAHALYNLTHYGNSRDILNMEVASEHPDMPNPYFDMKPAMAAYRRALQLYADKENKAKVLFMLAKCEQNDYYNQPDVGLSESYYWGEEDACSPKKNQEYRKNFAELRKNYSKTTFYKEALKECSYFQHYVAAH